MVQHARALIGAQGVESVTINDVLRLSGGSKATLVKYFGGRDGLISAAIGEEAREAIIALRLEDSGIGDLPLAEGLGLMLRGILRFYMTPGALMLYRAVVSIGARERGTAAAFYDHGHRVLVDALAQFLNRHRGTSVASHPDLADIADQMLHTIRAGLYERALLGLAPQEASDDLIEHRVQSALTIFLPGLKAVLDR